jgi:hypothetical protein
MFKIIIANIALLLTFSTFSFAYAQVPPPSNTPVATVNIQNATLSQQGHTLNVNFDLTNRTGAQPDVGYAVQLLIQAGGGQAVADQQVYNDHVSLGENANVHKSITYTAPASLSGTFDVVLVSKNSSGFPFALVNIGKVTLSSTGGITLQPETCYLQVSGEKSTIKYSLRQGVDVSANESVTLNCTATNTSNSSVTATPQFETHFRTMFGQVTEAAGGSTAAISFKAKESKAIAIHLPKAYTPQAYDVSTVLVSGGASSNTIVSHYVLRGPSATLQTITLDKNYYAASSQALVSFIWSPSADSFEGARVGHGSDSAVAYSATLTNASGAACASPVTGNLTDMNMKAQVAVTSACKDPHLTLALKDASGNVLAQKEIVMQSSGVAMVNSTWLLVALLVIICIILFAIFRYNRHMAARVLLPLLMVAGLAAAGAGIPLHSASADTFCVAGNHHWDAYTDENGVYHDQVDGWDNCMWQLTANLDKNSYAPGEPITANGSITAAVCDNEPYQAQFTYNAKAGYSSESHTLFKGTPAAQQENVWVTYTEYGSATFTNPSVPGSSYIRFIGSASYVDTNGNVQPTSNQVDIPFTVTGPVCVQNKGASCSSAANSCGQNSTGTILCDGSCSATVPACTCPAGQRVGSSGTCVPITCPAGQQLSGNQCVPITCPPGQAMSSSGSCVPITCPTGQSLGSNGQCVTNTCPVGETRNANGTCSAGSCPAGQVLSNGVCTTPSCPSGQVLSGGVCVPSNCPQGQVLSGSQCVPITCPTGQTFNPATNACATTGSQCGNNTGQTCTSATNSCGMTNVGTVQCNGSCSASAPSDAQCNTSGGTPTLTLVASPSRVRSGTATELSWNASGTGIASCTVSGTNGFHASGTTGNNINSGPINQATTFTFTCLDTSGNATSVSQTVQPLPIFNEQ